MPHPFKLPILAFLLFLCAAMQAPAQEPQPPRNLDDAIAGYTQAIALNPKNALAYINRGKCKEARGDFDGAIADYNSAIAINPGSALPYYDRSIAAVRKGKLDAALDDANRAISLDPSQADFYNNRGIVKQLKGDLPGAIGDFTHAISLWPKDALAYMNRGNVKQDQGDQDAAIADFTRAIDLDPKNAPLYFNRAGSEALIRKWKEALADYRKYSDLYTGNVLLYQDYTHLYIWLMRARLGDTAAAGKELWAYLGSRTAAAGNDWFSHITDYLLGKITETDLMAAAVSTDADKDSGQHCEASFYIGITKLLAGDKKAAADSFDKTLATGRKEFVEYQLAAAELKTLRQ